MAAHRDEQDIRTSLFGRLRQWIPQGSRSDAGSRRCPVCCGHAICLRCGGRGRVLIVPMGWQRKPYLQDCPDCEATGACVECGVASLN